MPVDDPDCDGFSSTREVFVGTLALVACPASGDADGVDNDGNTIIDEASEGVNDEDPDAWPPDADDDQDVDIGDVIVLFAGGKLLIDDENPLYSTRSDMDGNGQLNTGDIIIAFTDTLLLTCRAAE